MMIQKRQSRAKMADVAQESGVSLSTVSMVLGNKPGLPTETRIKVLNAARRLGYASHRTALAVPGLSALRTVGVVTRARQNEIPLDDNFYSLVIAGIEAACRQNNLSMLYSTVNSDLENHPLEIPRLLQEGGVDGLLLVGIYLDQGLSKIVKESQLPVVLVDAYTDNNDFDCVVSDNFTGGYQATAYLIEKGHRKIGFVGGAENAYPSFAERRRGYAQAMRDHKIDNVFFADCISERDAASEAAKRILNANPELTALVGVNDFVAITAMHMAVELGRAIGDDISFIGYDDIFLSESVIPRLTTIHVDKLAMGRAAVQLLLNRVSQPEMPSITATMNIRLIERNSVKTISADIQAPAQVVTAQSG